MNRLHDEIGPQVYVIGYDEGPQKIGFSEDPRERTKTLKVAGELPLKVHGTVMVRREHMREVEQLAHWLLRDLALGSERFAVTPEKAFETIRSAKERHAKGERAPPNPNPYAKCINVTAPASFLQRVEEWRARQRPVPTKAEAMRILAERQLDAEAANVTRTTSEPRRR